MNNKRINKLLCELQNGNDQIFLQLYEETYRGVFSFIYSIIKDYQSSEDILQDAYIKLKRNIQYYKANSNATAWMLEIAKNLSIDYLRKKIKKETIEYNDECTGVKSNNENKLYLMSIMNTYLDTIDRQIVILKIHFGYKAKEISKFLNLPLGTVLWKYNNAIKILRNKIEEDSNEK